MKLMYAWVTDPPVNHSGACQFRFSSDLGKNEVFKATLGVYVRRTATTAWTTYLLVYAVVQRSTQVRQMIGRRPIHLRSGSTSSWHQFKITREVRAWLDDPASNNGLIIEATDDRGVPVVVVQTTRPEEESFVSFFDYVIESGQRSVRSSFQNCFIANCYNI